MYSFVFQTTKLVVMHLADKIVTFLSRVKKLLQINKEQFEIPTELEDEHGKIRSQENILWLITQSKIQTRNSS